MKNTPHKVLGHRVRLAQGGWLVIKVRRWEGDKNHLNLWSSRGSYSIAHHRQRTLWQLERSMRGLLK